MAQCDFTIGLIYSAILCFSSALAIDLKNCTFAEEICPNDLITFWLYKIESREQPIKLNALNLTLNDFEPKRPLRILIHGFTGHSDDSPNLELRPVLLQTLPPVHVISVDYEKLAPFPCYYPWGVSNARQVAKCLGELLNKLVDQKIVSWHDIHLIGFSLGAQVAGLTANYVQRRLTRITALDPASLGFMTFDLHSKLDVTDADFVDVLHTDPFVLSSPEQIGHVDFYANLGFGNQPGCNTHLCSHFRAPAYYAESVVDKNGFWAHNCGSWFDFFLGRCFMYANRPYARMGYFGDMDVVGSYMLNTRPQRPFAMGPPANFELEVIENNRKN